MLDQENGLRAADLAPDGDVPPVHGIHILVTVNASWNLLNFRRSLIESLLSDGNRVTILAPRDASTERLVAMGCDFIPLDMDSKGLSPAGDLKLLVRILKALRQARPDVILGYTIKNNIYGALSARLLGIPFLPNVSGLGTAFLGQSWLRIVAKGLYRTAFSRVPVVFFQNDDDRALFVAEGLIPAERTHVLPGSGIDLRHFSPAPIEPRSSVRFLLIARMLRDKGVEDFVEAARLMLDKGVEAEFTLLGPADSANRTAIGRDEIESWVREGIVAYREPVEDVRPFIADADCIVLPSYREGAPRTLIEAAAMARPVVASRVPGCTAVVEDGITGLLCNVRDSADLARQLQRMVALGPEGRQAMGAAGREKMEREYDQALVVAAYRGQIRRCREAADAAG